VPHSPMQPRTFAPGKAPWFNTDGARKKKAFVIGIAGGSASGKTTVAKKILSELNVPWVAIMSQDSFYKELGPSELEAAHNNNYDFDAPDSIDIELLCATLRKLKEGQRIQVPIYDFSTHSRSPETEEMYGANVVILEGLFALMEPIASILDVKVFVDDPEDVRLERRLKRDVLERGRDREGCLKQYHRFVKPSFDKYIQPTLCTADIVVPRGVDNKVAMALMLEHIKQQMALREGSVRQELKAAGAGGIPTELPSSISVLEPTLQVRGMHTIIRNVETSREDFVFYSERLMRSLFEHANSFLPYNPVEVKTINGKRFKGGGRLAKRVVGVSILTSGMSMEASFRTVHRNAAIGKILIQTNVRTGEPELHYSKLPNLEGASIIVMDSTLSTGATAMMAVRVLLDHGVAEADIIFTTMIASKPGCHWLANAFPSLRVVASAIDDIQPEQHTLTPGMGDFGRRYFGNERRNTTAKTPVKD